MKDLTTCIEWESGAMEGVRMTTLITCNESGTSEEFA
jgi:hypothetical protein